MCTFVCNKGWAYFFVDFIEKVTVFGECTTFYPPTFYPPTFYPPTFYPPDILPPDHIIHTIRNRTHYIQLETARKQFI